VAGRCASAAGDGAPPGSPCAGSDECASGLCALAGRCVAPCGLAERDCPPTDDCAEGVVRHPDPGSTARIRFCAPRFALPPRVEATFERRPRGLDPDPLLEDDGPRAEIRVPSPAPESLTVLALSCLDRPVPRPERLVPADDPDDVLFLREALTVGAPKPRNTVEAGRPLVVRVPNGALDRAPDVPLALLVSRASRSDLDVHVLRWDPSRGAGTRLDLDVFYVGVPGLGPEGDRGPPALAAALDRVDELLAPAGIRIGQIAQHEVPGTLGDQLGLVEEPIAPDEPDELGALLSLGRGKVSPSLSLFIVRGTDPATLGLAGGIPVPLGVPGTAGSGLLISWELAAGDPEIDLGQVLAHELGHALGLFHPTEGIGTVFDPLPDTPVCPLPDGAFFLSREDCGGLGAENLMFFQVAPVDAPNELTPDQAGLLSRAPILR